MKPRAEVLESLVELYLRLNGYFCISNYLYHRTDKPGLETESDVLAIRMPHQEELLRNGRRQQNDPTLILAEDRPMTDCVIAEVKEPCVTFNRPIWRPDGEWLIAAALRMFGVFPRAAFEGNGLAKRLAHDLHNQISNPRWPGIPSSKDPEYNVSVRMILFAPETATRADQRKYFDLQHVLDFTRCRMRPGVPCKEYARSPCWHGCTLLILEALDESHRKGLNGLPLEEFIKNVVSRMPAKPLHDQAGPAAAAK